MREESINIVNNKEIIQINQDRLQTSPICITGCTYWDRLMRRPTIKYARLEPKQYSEIQDTEKVESLVLVATNWAEVST